ncbi:MAG: alpha/beta fold hydrolase [Clostridiales bacterium]|nr:alpha/beta fold hydrolase [Clostridiales bacterium]
MSNECCLKYPLLMVHGMGFRDRKHLCYWGRIPKVLESQGANVFFGHQDAVGSVEGNADIIAKSLDEVLKITGAPKVNILAHSKGGLESRYLFNHGYSDKIASITTIDTPHHGSKTVDFLMKAPKWMVKAAAKGNDIWHKMLGDKHPDSYACFDILTTGTAEKFNIDNPTPDNILCQSYGFKCKGSFSDSVFCITYPIVRKFDGDNDGMVSTDSMHWADFKGIRTSTTHRGISHADVVDMRRRRFTKKTPSSDNEVSDIVPFYVEVVKGLKEKGY